MENKLKELREQNLTEITELGKYKSSVSGVLEEAIELERQIQEVNITYATEKQKLISVDEDISKLEIKLDALKNEKEDLVQKQKDIKIKIEKIECEIKQIDIVCEGLKNKISEFSTSHKDSQTYIDELNYDIVNLKISISSFDESEMPINELVERIENDIENSKLKITKKQLIIEDLLKENSGLTIAIEKNNNLIIEIQKTIEEQMIKINSFKGDRELKNRKLEDIEKSIINQFKNIEILKDKVTKLDVKIAKVEDDIEQYINKMWEEYEITPNNAIEYVDAQNSTDGEGCARDIAKVERKVVQLRNEIKDLGSINIDSIEEYKQTKQRYDFMSEQKLDLEITESKLKKIISDMIIIMKEQFLTQFKLINENFGKVFSELFGGGRAEVKLSDEENVLESGIEIEVQPPGKKLQNMMLLSGGEKALTAIALLFAILNLNPAPFCILDEIEAALDDINVYRFADYLKRYVKTIQFLLITHRKGTMAAADMVYGVTMEENGISKAVSIKF